MPDLHLLYPENIVCSSSTSYVHSLTLSPWHYRRSLFRVHENEIVVVSKGAASFILQLYQGVQRAPVALSLLEALMTDTQYIVEPGLSQSHPRAVRLLSEIFPDSGHLSWSRESLVVALWFCLLQCTINTSHPG